MEARRLQQLGDGAIIPSHAMLQTLADNFSASPERAGKVVIQPRQVWKWFQNRRSSLLLKTTRATHHGPSSSSSLGRKPLQGLQLEFEAKSAHDGAWYDVGAFLSHRWLKSGDLEVLVRFSGFGVEYDEWLDVRKCVRQCSLPCAAEECVAVVHRDLILCYQERKEQGLYFDAHILDIQRRRHDVKRCHCRFLVRYDHDSSEEIVPLSKVCRRPETDYRLLILYAARLAATTDVHTPRKEVIVELTSNDKSPAKHKPEKQDKMMDMNTDEVTMVSSLQQEGTAGKAVSPLLSATSEACNSSSDGTTKEVEASMVVEDDEVQVVAKMKEV